MSIEQIIEMLLQHGSLGIFAAYLIYQTSQLRRQQENQVDKFENLIDKIRTDSKAEQQMIRDRYDKVIGDLQGKENVLRDNFSLKIEDIARRVEQVEKGVDAISIQIDDLKARFQDMKLREMAKKAARAEIT